MNQTKTTYVEESVTEEQMEHAAALYGKLHKRLTFNECILICCDKDYDEFDIDTIEKLTIHRIKLLEEQPKTYFYDHVHQHQKIQ